MAIEIEWGITAEQGVVATLGSLFEMRGELSYLRADLRSRIRGGGAQALAVDPWGGDTVYQAGQDVEECLRTIVHRAYGGRTAQ